MTQIVLDRDRSEDGFDPLFLWQSDLSRVGFRLNRIAGLYWVTHQRGLNRLSHFRYLNDHAAFFFKSFIDAGCGRLELRSIYPGLSQSIPLEWGEHDVVFRNRVEALLTDIQRCRLTDHDLRAEIIASVVDWTGDEIETAADRYTDVKDRLDVEMVIGSLLGWISDTRTIRDAAERVALRSCSSTGSSSRCEISKRAWST